VLWLQVYNRLFERAETDEEKDAVAACHELLIQKMHTAYGMDDIDAKFRRHHGCDGQ